jgi:hypothetical protein
VTCSEAIAKLNAAATRRNGRAIATSEARLKDFDQPRCCF